MIRRGTNVRGVGRREFLGIAGAGAGAVALGLAGCSSDDSGGDGGTAGGEVDLSFWLPGGSDIFQQTHEDIAEKYREIRPNVTVEVQTHTGEQGFLEVFLARIAGGNPPSASVIWDTPVSLGVLGSLMDLEPFMETSENSQLESWPDGVLASCQFEGRTYGLPVTAGSYAMWYNEEWFEEKGIPSDRDSFPKTWDELRALSKEFTRWDGDRLESAGFIPPFVAGSSSGGGFTVPIWSALNGGMIFDAANQRYTIDSESNIAMMEYFVSWLDEEYQGDFQKVVNSGAWGGYPEEGQPPGFQEGRVATIHDGTWLVGDFYDVESTFERWNVAAMPVGPGGTEPVSGFWPNWLVIPTASNNPEEAFGYLDYMAVEGAQDWFNVVPDLPTNTKVPIGELSVPDVVDRRGEAFVEDVIDFFRGQLEIATPMWDSPVQSFATDQLQRSLERIGTKTATPQEALAEAQSASQAELERVLSAG